MIKIAIIDDEPQITSMLQKSLCRNSEFGVTVFNNPLDALNRMTSSRFDVALLDIMMPQMDGIEVLGRIKEKCPETKVIMITAYSTLDRVLDSHKSGAEDYVMKPFDSLKAVEEKILKVFKGQ